MKIEKLIEILDKEEAERQRGMVTPVSLELIRESNFDLRPFLADAFSKRMSRNLDRELTNTAEWVDVTDLTLCDEFAAYELGLWLSKLEKRLRSQSGRDRLSKSLPGVEKAEKGSGANRSRKHNTHITQFPHTLDADLNPIRPS
jgi:hypothetical protein